MTPSACSSESSSSVLGAPKLIGCGNAPRGLTAEYNPLPPTPITELHDFRRIHSITKTENQPTLSWFSPDIFCGIQHRARLAPTSFAFRMTDTQTAVLRDVRGEGGAGDLL